MTDSKGPINCSRGRLSRAWARVYKPSGAAPKNLPMSKPSEPLDKDHKNALAVRSAPNLSRERVPLRRDGSWGCQCELHQVKTHVAIAVDNCIPTNAQ